MSHKQVMHVIRVLLLLGQNPLQKRTSRWVVVTKMPHHVAISLNGDSLCNQIFLDHVNQIVALDILRGRSRRDALRIEVWLSAELIDSLSEKVEMLLFLLRVLSEFFFDRLTGEACSANRMVFVAEYANDLRRHSMVQDRDAVFNLSLIVLGDGTVG